jgi:hypothetical protein
LRSGLECSPVRHRHFIMAAPILHKSRRSHA